jgi:phosphate/sulfate permease
MERFVTLALILMGQYEAVGLLIAAKSILRYNNNQKTEYVLVGTLLSFGFAILIGALISKM